MSLFSALSVSASGMAAQRTRAELLTENLANAETTRTPEGGPYRRKDAVFVAPRCPAIFIPSSPLSWIAAPGRGGQRSRDRYARSGHPLSARPSRCRCQRLCRVSTHQSGGGHGRSDVDLARLPGQRRRHLGGKRHDPEVARHSPIAYVHHHSANSQSEFSGDRSRCPRSSRPVVRAPSLVLGFAVEHRIGTVEQATQNATTQRNSFCPARTKTFTLSRSPNKKPSSPANYSCRCATKPSPRTRKS